MYVFHIHYRNTQGTFMRIMSAISRRGIDIPYVQATPNETGHRATLLLDVNPKQIGQLSRDWHAIVDVVDVRAGALTREITEVTGEWTTVPHPRASSVGASGSARAAMA